MPKSDLPALDLGNGDDLQLRLDKLYAEGGLAAVNQWVTKELQPGRTVTYSGESGVLLDRSVWRLDAQSNPTKQSVVAPLTDEHSGKLLAVIGRPLAKEPFMLRLRRAR